MNNFYFDLPDIFRSFLNIPNDFENQIIDFQNHGYIFKKTTDLFNENCFDYFKERNLELTDETKVFSIPANCIAEPHTDTPTKFAFNFVVRGYGEMQWLNVQGKSIIIDRKVPTGQRSQYRKFIDIEKVEILETWKNDIGLVKVNGIHRIVTFDQRRICISLRLKLKHRNIDFNEMVELIK